MVRLEKNDPLMLARQLPLKTVALILAGGRGTRLKDLTIKRAKPAVHFGGKFRIIDFALSNCLTRAFAVLASLRSISRTRWFSISSAAVILQRRDERVCRSPSRSATRPR